MVCLTLVTMVTSSHGLITKNALIASKKGLTDIVLVNLGLINFLDTLIIIYLDTPLIILLFYLNFGTRVNAGAIDLKGRKSKGLKRCGVMIKRVLILLKIFGI